VSEAYEKFHLFVAMLCRSESCYPAVLRDLSNLYQFKEVFVKKQISQLSASQNGKVFGVLMALSSLVFVVPMAIMFSFFPFGVDRNGNPVEGPPVLIFLLFPVFYLVFGYIMVAIGCKFYNFMFKYIGGIEYEARDEQV